ncbi:Agouti-signaling protein [Egretta garzetta]|uniref:Agouti-signaling protein n=1 Tax=Egretta garzetta TaxID=188379 RepID=A0A091JT19_EGRGA|nr:Agouti-signaling protein [Egretta garzetta]
MALEFFLPRMERKSLFLSLLLCYSLLQAAHSYMVIEEKTECNLSRSNKMTLQDLPPISIVAALLSHFIVNRDEAISQEKEKSSKKNAEPKTSPKPRPTPAADCVPNFKTCKPHLNSCCNYCALCKCRIFQTICQCLMLSPKC